MCGSIQGFEEVFPGVNCIHAAGARIKFSLNLCKSAGKSQNTFLFAPLSTKLYPDLSDFEDFRIYLPDF